MDLLNYSIGLPFLLCISYLHHFPLHKTRPINTSNFCVFPLLAFWFCSSPGMNLPTVQLLSLKQGDRLLSIDLYPGLFKSGVPHSLHWSLCVFYIASLSERSKALLLVNGPKGNFNFFVDWVLERYWLFFTFCHYWLRTTPAPLVIQRPACHYPSAQSICTYRRWRAWIHRDIRASAWTLDWARHCPEPEPQDLSDHVCEPATTVGVLVEIEGLEGSLTHTPAAEGELQLTVLIMRSTGCSLPRWSRPAHPRIPSPCWSCTGLPRLPSLHGCSPALHQPIPPLKPPRRSHQASLFAFSVSVSLFISPRSAGIWRHLRCDPNGIMPSEGPFGVKRIMAAILKGYSKPKCS